MIVPMVRDVGTRDVHRSPANLGVSVLARKLSAHRADLRWDLTASDVLASQYPTDGRRVSGAAEVGGRS